MAAIQLGQTGMISPPTAISNPANARSNCRTAMIAKITAARRENVRAVMVASFSLPRRRPGLIEHPLALLVDDLAAFRQREIGCLLNGREPVGTDEFVLLHLAADFLGDGARRLKLAAVLVGRCADDEALVLGFLSRGSGR